MHCDNRFFKARFHPGYGELIPLNPATYYKSPAHSSTGTKLSFCKTRILHVNLRFHVLFHTPPGVLFTFPSRYSFTIGHLLYSGLSRWVCAYVGFLGDPFPQIFLWGEAYFTNPGVVSGFTNFGSHLLLDYGVLSFRLRVFC